MGIGWFIWICLGVAFCALWLLRDEFWLLVTAILCHVGGVLTLFPHKMTSRRF